MADNDILMSDFFDIDFEKFDANGIFDAVLNHDSAFFINVLRLKQAITPEFKVSYKRINDYFVGIATLLDAADENSTKDKCYRTALKNFSFSEVNGINLGFSQSATGAGFGAVLSKQVISDAYVMVKKGCNAPELFHMLQLFEDGVGPDRLSDMIATIILPDIKSYTLRIMRDLDICPGKYDASLFNADGFIINPFKKCPVYFLPVEILHELPVAKCWEDIDHVVFENNCIRAELNAEIGSQWEKWHSTERKDYLKQKIFMDPEAFERVITGYREEILEMIDLNSDEDYSITKFWQRVKKKFDFKSSLNKSDGIGSLDGALEIVEIFKDWVENNRGWAEVQDKKEKTVQRLIHLGAKAYLNANDLDLSCEANEGPGPVDFKISRGNDKTVVELKLSTNQDYLHGYEEQVKRYAVAEHTENMVFVYVDMGNPRRTATLKKAYEDNLAIGKTIPIVVIVNSTDQVSASKRGVTGQEKCKYR